MRTTRSRWSLSGLAALATCVTGAAVILLTPSSASASGDLSSAILTTQLPGFVAEPSGPYNGPLDASTLPLVEGLNSQDDAQVKVDLAVGGVSGYLRLWVFEPRNGDAIGISAFQFKKSADEQTFAETFNSAVKAQAGVSSFAVPLLSQASGYVLHTATTGPTGAEYLVSFLQGDIAFQVTVSTSSGDLSEENAVGIAMTQAALAPDTPPSGVPTPLVYKAGVIGGSVLFGIFVLGFTIFRPRRRRTKTPYTSLVPTAPMIVTRPPLPPAAQEPGWTFVGDSHQVQWYWDGTAWTGRKLLTAGGWVER